MVLLKSQGHPGIELCTVTDNALFNIHDGKDRSEAQSGVTERSHTDKYMVTGLI